MHIYVNGKNIEITDAIKAYVKEKMGKVVSYYDQIQGRRNVTFAVRQPYAKQADINYSVCGVTEFINSEFFNEKECTDFIVLKTSDKNIEAAKKIVNANKVSDNDINNAVKSFNNWFNIWSVHNDFSTNQTPTITNNVIEEAPVMDEVIEDIPEIKMESISSASDESVNEDNVENVLDEADEIVEEVVEEAKKPSKIEELAKKTFDEINAKVDNLKNKNKGKNLIEKINSVTEDISADIDNTFNDIKNKVVDTLNRTEDKENAKAVKEETIEKQKVTAEAKEVISDNIDDVVEEKQEVVEDIVTKTKRAIKEKEEVIQKQQAVEANQEVKEKVAQQSEELREILEAPVADGQDLSPEELKRIYRNKIKNAVKNANVQVEVIER